jgi:hypothetical protein
MIIEDKSQYLSLKYHFEARLSRKSTIQLDLYRYICTGLSRTSIPAGGEVRWKLVIWPIEK